MREVTVLLTSAADLRAKSRTCPDQGPATSCAALEMVRTSSPSEGASALDFESFFEREFERLFRALCLVVGDAHEAEEVVQEAFAVAWERWDRVANMESPAGYVFRVAVNGSRRRHRRALFARTHVEPPATKDQFERVEDEDEASRALTSLPTQQRSALVLTSYLGYSSEEAAAILGIKSSTVRVLTTRARSTLRASLVESEHE